MSTRHPEGTDGAADPPNLPPPAHAAPSVTYWRDLRLKRRFPQRG